MKVWKGFNRNLISINTVNTVVVKINHNVWFEYYNFHLSFACFFILIGISFIDGILGYYYYMMI